MSDNTQHENGLEEFFRNKTKSYNIPYQEKDWHNLEKQLDLQDQVYAWRRKVWIMAAASVLLILTLTGLYVMQLQDANVAEPDPGITETLILPEIPTQSVPGLTDGFLNEQLKDGRSNLHAAGITEQQIYRESGFREGADTMQPKATPLRVIEAELSSAVMEKPEIRSTFLNREPPDLIAYEPPKTRHLQRSALSRISLSGLSVSLLFTPDFSSVDALSLENSPGYRLGIRIDYALSDRISVSAGAVRANVNYSATGGTILSNFPGMNPEKMQGTCLMIDFPVHLNAEVLRFRSSSILVSAGFSSYYMMNERYKFTFVGDIRDYETTTYEWSENTGSWHFFSNIHLSAGFETRLSDQFSVRFAPFLKVPVQEVGWANASLYSAGADVSIGFSF